MGAAGQAASALPGGHVEGFGDTFCAHFRAIYADVVAGASSARPGYPTFADGHDEMLVGDAIAESARTGRWVDRRSRPPIATQQSGGTRPMKLGLLTAPFPDDAADGRRRLDRRERLREHRDRLLAARLRPDPPLRRHVPHRRREPVGRARRTELRERDRGQGPAHLGPRLLPQPAAPRPGPPRGGHRPPQARHHRRREDGRAARQHVHGRRRRARHQDANWEEALRVWPDIVVVRPGPRPQAHHRELPDAVQLRRVAGRPQPRRRRRGSGAGSWSSGAARSGSTSTRRT